MPSAVPALSSPACRPPSSSQKPPPPTLMPFVSSSSKEPMSKASAALTSPLGGIRGGEYWQGKESRVTNGLPAEMKILAFVCLFIRAASEAST